MGVVAAPWENRESCANHERYRHCKRGGARRRWKPVIGENSEKAFDRAKTRLEEVTAEIQEKQTASANMGTFLNAFEQTPDSLTEFSLESWHSMVDFATVYSIDDIRFTFKNGQEIQA